MSRYRINGAGTTGDRPPMPVVVMVALVLVVLSGLWALVQAGPGDVETAQAIADDLQQARATAADCARQKP